MKMLLGMVIVLGAVGHVEQGGSFVAGIVAMGLGCYMALTFKPAK